VTDLRHVLAFASLEGHEHYVTAVVVLGDPESERGGPTPGFRLATASNDGSVQVRAAEIKSKGGGGVHHFERVYRLWSTRAALVCVHVAALTCLSCGPQVWDGESGCVLQRLVVAEEWVTCLLAFQLQLPGWEGSPPPPLPVWEWRLACG
jgi:hypothetical protein